MASWLSLSVTREKLMHTIVIAPLHVIHGIKLYSTFTVTDTIALWEYKKFELTLFLLTQPFVLLVPSCCDSISRSSPACNFLFISHASPMF